MLLMAQEGNFTIYIIPFKCVDEKIW